MSEVEHRASRNHRPKSLTDGKYMSWDFSSHDGRRFPEESCRRGKHEIIKTKWMHLLIQMQLARRGGHLARRKFHPKNVGGHVHAIRLQLIAKDLDAPHPKWWKKKDKNVGETQPNRTVEKPIPLQETATEHKEGTESAPSPQFQDMQMHMVDVGEVANPTNRLLPNCGSVGNK